MSTRDSGRSHRPTLGHLILALATAIALTALPISIEPEFDGGDLAGGARRPSRRLSPPGAPLRHG